MKPNFKKIKAEKLQEQLKFFGAKKTRFISCYAKKPRVRVTLKTEPHMQCNDNNRDYLLEVANDHLRRGTLGSNNYYNQSALGGASDFANLSGLGQASAASSALQQSQAIDNARKLQAKHLANAAAKCGLINISCW